MKSVLREKVSISSINWPYFMIYQALKEVCLSCYLAGGLIVFFYPFDLFLITRVLISPNFPRFSVSCVHMIHE